MAFAINQHGRRRRLFTIRCASQSPADCRLASSETTPGPQEPPGWSVSQADADDALWDRFRRACGQHSGLRIDIRSAGSGSEHPPVVWNRPSLIVGSGVGCDLRLPHSEVSDRHAYFQFIDGRLYCADLDSRTGTHWSHGATQAGWVEANEPVTIGPYSLTFAFDPRPCPADTRRPDSAERPDCAEPHAHRDTARGEERPPAAEAFLEFLNAGAKVRPYRVTREVTLIGSGSGVKIHLTHPSVSTVHCSLVRTASGLWIVDLLSAEGTIVNGHTELLAALKPSDEFQIGRFLTAVHYGHAEEAAEPSPHRHVPHGQPVKDSHETAESSTATHRVPAYPYPGEQSGNGNSPAAATSSPDPARDASPAEAAPPLPGDGLSEQLMLSMVRELGAMQQQFLRQVQDSLRETLVQFSAAYEQRLQALERTHAELRDQLVHRHPPTPGTPTADQHAGFEAVRRDNPPAHQANGSRTASVPPMTTAAQQASGAETAKPTRNGASGAGLHQLSGQHPPELRDGSGPPANHQVPPLTEQPPRFPADVTVPPDADDRARWIREQIKSIELDLETTGRGWEKKLVELLGQ